MIAEDEPVLRKELHEALAHLWPELEIAALAADGLQALRALEQVDPKVLFLDIEMPGLSGLQVAARANGACHVVFVTAYDKYAIEAFERGAVDYVLKPFTLDRLAGTVARLKERLWHQPVDLQHLLAALHHRNAEAPQHLRWIRASQGQHMRLITVDEVVYFQSDHKYTVVVTADGEALIRKPIGELLVELDPQQFWQINRGTIVNASEISRVLRTRQGGLELRLKHHTHTLAVSASHVHRFKQM